MKRESKNILACLLLGYLLNPAVFGHSTTNDVKGRVLDQELVEHHGHPIVVDGNSILVFENPGGYPKAIPYIQGEAIVVGASTYRERRPSDRRLAERAGDLDPIEVPFLETTDGQRLPGGILRTGDGRILWRNAWLPSQTLDPERISRLRIVQGAEVPVATDSDLLILVNGDRLEGFVESIGTSIALEIVDGDREGEIIEVPIDRVASVSLSNPVVRRGGVMVWFRGGHRILGSSIRIEDDGYTRIGEPRLGGGEAEVPSEFLMGANLKFDRIVPWSSLEWRIREDASVGVRPWTPPIEREAGHHPLDAAPMRIQGPMTAAAKMPWSGARYRLVVERDPDAGTGRSVFVVRDGEVEVSRDVIDADRSVVVVTGRIEGDTIEFELEDGGDGPFEDDVVLREALIIRSRG